MRFMKYTDFNSADFTYGGFHGRKAFYMRNAYRKS